MFYNIDTWCLHNKTVFLYQDKEAKVPGKHFQPSLTSLFARSVSDKEKSLQFWLQAGCLSQTGFYKLIFFYWVLFNLCIEFSKSLDGRDFSFSLGHIIPSGVLLLDLMNFLSHELYVCLILCYNIYAKLNVLIWEKSLTLNSDKSLQF